VREEIFYAQTARRSSLKVQIETIHLGGNKKISTVTNFEIKSTDY